MQDLLLLGAGVHSQEIVEIVERVNQVAPTWHLLGYLTTEAAQVGTLLNGYPVLGTPEALGQYPEACLLPSFDWPHPNEVARERLISLIDPSAVVSRTAQIGVGCVVYPLCFVGLNVRLGDFVFCLSGCVINHDDVLGDHVTLASGVRLAGEVQVEAGCYLGQACTIRQSLHIGQGSLIGMGAVVLKDVPPNSVMAGNPAQRLRDRE